MKRSIPMCALLLGLAALGACNDDSEKLAAAHRKWQRAAITDYEFDYRNTGFAPPAATHIVVENGVVAAVDAVDGESAPGLDLAHAPTIESLFDKVEQQLEGDSDVRVTWDPALGFPVDAYFDHGGEGDGFTVSAFARTP